MDSADLKDLPVPARRYIKGLETRIARLERTLTQELAQVKTSLGRRSNGAHLPKEDVQATTGLADAVARGEAAKVRWIASGEVISATTLAAAWGLTPQALGPAAKRGEVFAMVIRRARYYPKEFLELDREDVATVCKALGELSPSEKFVFWKRRHGVLSGKTVLEVLASNKDAAQRGLVIELATAWACEAGAGIPAAGDA